MRDPRIESLMVISYNPSHSNVNSEVNAPFKILCTLIRCIDNETHAKTVKPTEVLEEAKELLKPWLQEPMYEGRMDTEENQDEDYGFNDEKFSLSNALDVEMDNVEEEEIYPQPNKLFSIEESKDKGLADLEVGSACYMSEMLNFNFEEYEDCEEMKEEDLLSLNDSFLKEELKTSLISGINEIILHNKEYVLGCYSHLLKQDQKLVKTYLSLK